ncbi:symmetrical bis(5'-nucleosyl)-tetraphosphatase [Marinicella litoralis]|uniref:bis(5'-nucleosyl)-tetraphosphatase (symmetrical) n=1 Tax=Marinicella litoralis TaxID=644220 RepID=A0A4R6XFY2_9GAMM|nr:symmetrical bis(5'-nucleosyl)-tetraphosphatase [Marinicella litoralis]TDR18296.1 bis(5'nucleosyl)-tetraphosphatase ApaH [Marinicella litoralis]
MATYVIGDVQGCFDPLMQLTKLINYDPKVDRLIFCGDLVNRGGKSLDVLRWVYAHQNSCDTVLGNHDLSLLSKYFSDKKIGTNKEFNAVFLASDVSLLIGWLLQRPFYIETNDYFINHAGLYPLWTLSQFKALAANTQQELVSNTSSFLAAMYGNKPSKWIDSLDMNSTHRFFINACTRMRFVKTDGRLNFSENKKISTMKSLKPWFQFESISNTEKHLVFGHWSALGFYQDNNVTCLDTGKVWGGQLTALRLDDKKLFSV